ncbi:MAG: T9SS type A sorting domain-containing protein [Flavobacteriaceae bacterium]|nr:T9SS type A sorting domain-containing protein [Flavobacteriaceae bacterium]
MKQLIFICMACILSIGYAQIDQAEYFIDSDPGVTLGTPITINTPGLDINESFTVDTGPLSNGIHTLFVRTRDVNGVWSLYYKHTFLVHDFVDTTPATEIVAAEYFVDADPGTDGGTDILPITSGFDVTESLAISTAAISDGIHKLHVRVKDSDDRWSLYYEFNFLVHTFTPPVSVQINKAEYFFDTDPGTNLGTPIAITPGFDIDETVQLPTGGLAEGLHYLHLRTRDENGVWSLYEVFEFLVEEALGTDDVLLLQIKVYPTVTSDYVTIDSEVTQIEKITLYDIHGRVISTMLNPERRPIQQVDVRFLSNGTYIMHVQTEDKVLTKKIIKN